MNLHTDAEQTKLLLVGCSRVSVYICTIKITVLTKYKINNINNTKINAFGVTRLVKTKASLFLKSVVSASADNYKQFFSSKLHFPWSTGCKHPISHNFFSIYIFFISCFSLIYLYIFIFFCTWDFLPPPFLNWPTTVQPCSLLQPIRSRRPSGRQTVVRSKVRGHRGRGQQQQCPGRPPWCVSVCVCICVSIPRRTKALKLFRDLWWKQNILSPCSFLNITNRATIIIYSPAHSQNHKKTFLAAVNEMSLKYCRGELFTAEPVGSNMVKILSETLN